jgi:hypothetical protein
MSLVRQMRDGRDNAWEFGQRMKGNGPYAELLNQRFHLAARRLGLATRLPPLSTEAFRAPGFTSTNPSSRERGTPQQADARLRDERQMPLF